MWQKRCPHRLLPHCAKVTDSSQPPNPHPRRAAEWVRINAGFDFVVVTAMTFRKKRWHEIVTAKGFLYSGRSRVVSRCLVEGGCGSGNGLGGRGGYGRSLWGDCRLLPCCSCDKAVGRLTVVVAALIPINAGHAENGVAVNRRPLQKSHHQ